MDILPADDGSHRYGFDRPSPLVLYNGSSPPSSTTDELREILHAYSDRKSLALCHRGVWKISASGKPYRAVCGNKWACPQCSPRLLEADRAEIERVLQAHDDVLFLTFSISHPAGTPLGDALKALQRTWTRAYSTGSWMTDFRTRTRMAGWVRGTDITYPESGSHPHFHAAFTFNDQQPHSSAEALMGQWMNAASALGFTTRRQAMEGALEPHVPPGVRRAKVAYYLTEQNAIRESRPGKGRTPGDLIHSVNNTGDADDLALLIEYHDATKGKHKVSTSRGFRQLGIALHPLEPERPLTWDDLLRDDIDLSWPAHKRETGNANRESRRTRYAEGRRERPVYISSEEYAEYAAAAARWSTTWPAPTPTTYREPEPKLDFSDLLVDL